MFELRDHMVSAGAAQRPNAPHGGGNARAPTRDRAGTPTAATGRARAGTGTGTGT